MDIALRPVTDQDASFLHRVYASTRTQELAATGWDPAACEAFTALQFKAQQQHYQRHFPHAHHLVIEVRGQAVGRVYVHQDEQEIRLVDIALLPQHQAQGIGRQCLQTLLAKAATERLPVHLHVNPSNPARRLYQRLGFVASAAPDGLSVPMRWQAPDT
ncbi:MAG: GNAT family N-acetyltransferase [Burkholderiales bacterium]|nr:GNAT family N-acetyltransferase [Burkholderiales bacterium]